MLTNEVRGATIRMSLIRAKLSDITSLLTRLGSPAMTRQKGDSMQPIAKLGTQAPAQSQHKTWVQTERAAHEAWSRLVMKNGKAAALMHILVSQMGDQNAVVIPRGTLAKIMNASEATVKRAIAVLREERWIETVQLGGKGGVNAYIVNRRVAWQQSRDDLHLALFDAAIVADAKEQDSIGGPELRRVPVLYPGEEQLPSGQGEDPPAQALIEGLEPDLPFVTQPALVKKGN